MIRVAFEETSQHAQMVARLIYAESAAVLVRAGGRDAALVLGADRDLRTVLNAGVEYSPQLLYAVIADRAGRAILHSEAGRQGDLVPERPRFEELLALSTLRRIAALYGTDQIYEAVLPVNLDDRPFATIKVGIALPFVRSQLHAVLQRSLALGGVALLAAWGVALVLSNLTLRPVRRLAEDMERLRSGQFDLTHTLGPRDEFGKLALNLQLLGQQIHSDRMKMLSERSSYQHAVDQLEDGLLFFDAARRVQFLNLAAELVVGRPGREAVGAPLEAILEPQHPLRQLVEQAVAQGSDMRGVAATLPVDGVPSEFFVSVFTVTSGPDGAHGGALVLLKDAKSLRVSARTLQSLIRYLARLTALGRATSEVAHEVKNPLNAMAIHLALLSDQLGNAPEQVGRTLDVIRHEVDRLDSVVERFTSTVRAPEAMRKPLDLHAVLGDVTSLLEAEWRDRGVAFALELDPTLSVIAGDEELLRTAFMNIVVNACEGMPDGGSVTIRSAPDSPGFVRVAVSDTGTGIPADDMDRIFAAGFTTKAAGSGIGLALVRRIIDTHNGDVEILSRVGRGTTVVVRLPIG